MRVELTNLESIDLPDVSRCGAVGVRDLSAQRRTTRTRSRGWHRAWRGEWTRAGDRDLVRPAAAVVSRTARARPSASCEQKDRGHDGDRLGESGTGNLHGTVTQLHLPWYRRRPRFRPNTRPGDDAGGGLAQFACAGEAVANPRHREDEEWVGGVLLDLPPQVADVDVDHARLDRVLVAPDVVQDFFAR
jgi:hypothetical protein